LPPIISAQGLSKRYGATPLFENISFTVDEGSRIGVIGPNGSGKSTLLAMLHGQVAPDCGDVAIRKGMRLSAVLQISEFAGGETIRTVIGKALDRAKVAEDERLSRIAEILGRAGFTDLDAEAASLSGGWRKRLAIVEALVQRPDILLLDEPTNHLDLAGIKWLEETLQNAPFACVVVSHDRYFLETVASEMVEMTMGRCGFPGITARSWKPRNSTCTHRGTGRRRWKIACIRKSSGCGAGPRRGPQNRRRALIKRTK
jgi:ABC transport system ATP-binding/permease protein